MSGYISKWLMLLRKKVSTTLLYVGSHYRPIINYKLDLKGEEAIILYTHMHFITNKFHLYHHDYILQEL